MNCKNCNKKIEKFDNVFHKLCKRCNIERLEARKKPKTYKHITRKRKSLKTKETRLKHTVRTGGRRIGRNAAVRIALDEAFYEECFNACKDHRCEECGTNLPDQFRDENGKVIMKSRYSHIVPKSKAPELRYSINNINHLCFNCHFKWEFGNKKEMKIYNRNRKKFRRYF